MASKILPRALKRSSKSAQPGYGDGIPPGGEGYYEYPDFSHSNRGGGDAASDGGGVGNNGGGGGGRLRMLRSSSAGQSRSARFLQRRSTSAPLDSLDQQQHGVGYDGAEGEENRGSKRGLFRRSSQSQKDKEEDHFPPLAGGERLPADGFGGSESDAFAARRSRHISTSFATADNDTWQENLAVVEVPATSAVNSSGRGGGGGWLSRSKNKASTVTTDNGMRLAIRSYFQSTKTGQRVWDEPPSGASDIQYATPEVRRMAELQMQDLQVTTSVAAAALQEEQQGMSNGEKPKRGGFFSRSKNGEKRQSPLPFHKRLSYRKGAAAYGATSAMAESRMEAKSAYERDMQMALAMSMQAEQNQPPPVFAQPRQMVGGQSGPRRTKDEDEAVMLATALSISEAEAAGGTPRRPSAPPMPGSPHYGGSAPPPMSMDDSAIQHEAYMRRMMNGHAEETPVLWASSEAGARGGMVGALNEDHSNGIAQGHHLPAYNGGNHYNSPQVNPGESPQNGMRRSQSERMLYDGGDVRMDSYDHDRRSLAKMVPEPDMGKERRASALLNRTPSVSKLKSTVSGLSPLKSKKEQQNGWAQKPDSVAPPDPVGGKQRSGLSASGSARRLLGRRKSDIDEGHDGVAEEAGLL